jgi:serine/threonine protein kinase
VSESHPSVPRLATVAGLAGLPLLAAASGHCGFLQARLGGGGDPSKGSWERVWAVLTGHLLILFEDAAVILEKKPSARGAAPRGLTPRRAASACDAEKVSLSRPVVAFDLCVCPGGPSHKLVSRARERRTAPFIFALHYACDGPPRSAAGAYYPASGGLDTRRTPGQAATASPGEWTFECDDADDLDDWVSQLETHLALSALAPVSAAALADPTVTVFAAPRIGRHLYGPWMLPSRLSGAAKGVEAALEGLVLSTGHEVGKGGFASVVKTRLTEATAARTGFEDGVLKRMDKPALSVPLDAMGLPLRVPKEDSAHSKKEVKASVKMWRSLWSEAMALERVALARRTPWRVRETVLRDIDPIPPGSGLTPKDWGHLCTLAGIGESDESVFMVLPWYDGPDAVTYVRGRASAHALAMKERAWGDSGAGRLRQEAGEERVEVPGVARSWSTGGEQHSIFPSAAAGGLPLGEVQMLGSQLIRAVAQLHRLGVAHRDIKPENLIFILKEPEAPIVPRARGSVFSMPRIRLKSESSNEGEPDPSVPDGSVVASSPRVPSRRLKRERRGSEGGSMFSHTQATCAILIDYGLAHCHPNLGGVHSLSGLESMVGTWWAVAPEIWRKQGPYDGAKADSWGLGVVLYWLSFGASPFRPAHPVTLQSYGVLAKAGMAMPPPGGWPDLSEASASVLGREPPSEWAPVCHTIRNLLDPDPTKRSSPLDLALLSISPLLEVASSDTVG